MVISERSCGRTNQMTGPIDMLLQTVALARAAALVVGYWPVRWATRQLVVEGTRNE
jgi:putative ABC transport system permease protein